MLSNYCPGANTETMSVPSKDVAVGKTHADSHSDSEVGACICVLLFSGPQFVWFITHPSHHYEQFYWLFQRGRFTLYGHAQVAWLQLLFLIKRIGSGNNLVLSCEPPVPREKAGLCRLAWDSISETVRGLRADHGPCSAVQNAICLQSGMTPVFIAWQRRSTSHSPWWLETATDAGVARAKTQSTGWSETFQWWKACSVCRTYWNGFSGRMEKAISDGSIWNVHSLPKLMECQSKGKWNGGRGVT